MENPILLVNDFSASMPIADFMCVPANPRRKWLSFVNAGANPVFIALDRPATILTGIGPVIQYGSVLLDMVNTPFYGNVHIIASGGVSQVNIIEVYVRE